MKRINQKREGPTQKLSRGTPPLEKVTPDTPTSPRKAEKGGLHRHPFNGRRRRLEGKTTAGRSGALEGLRGNVLGAGVREDDKNLELL